MATHDQTILFFKLWPKAKDAVCERFGLSPLDRAQVEDARHRWISQHTGVTSIKDVGRVEPFDRLMLETALIAEDYASAAHFSIACENRIRFLTEQCLRQLGELTRTGLPWDYVKAIFSHINLPEDWMDIPACDLLSVFEMLDTHRRRILAKDFGWITGTKFAPETHYYFDGTTLKLRQEFMLPSRFKYKERKAKEAVCST